MIHIPSVNLSQQFVPLAPAIFATQVIFNPSDEVIFERALDELVEDITGDQFIDVGTREVICKRLSLQSINELWPREEGEKTLR